MRKKFNLRFQNYGKVWRKKGERFKLDCLAPTFKSGRRSIFVWGCFSYYGIGNLVRIANSLNAKKYHNILKKQMFPSAQRLFNNKEFILQQDNSSIHKAKIIKNYLENKKQTVLEWPPQSPDLNCIENLWSIIDKKAKDRKPQNEKELFDVIFKTWKNIGLKTLQNLVKSMPKRLELVIAK